MRTKLAFLSLIVFYLYSCRSEHKVVEETNPDGSPKRVCIYKGDGASRELIKETTYYPNGKPQMEGTYKEGQRDGKWTYWHENGNLWSEGLFKTGKADGKRTTYFVNGKVQYEGTYKEDMRVGVWRFFDENGRLLKEADYSAPPKELIPPKTH
jgi:antitoxin component YwqK of YwqJK toxin-antitoxin module